MMTAAQLHAARKLAAQPFYTETEVGHTVRALLADLEEWRNRYHDARAQLQEKEETHAPKLDSSIREAVEYPGVVELTAE